MATGRIPWRIETDFFLALNLHDASGVYDNFYRAISNAFERPQNTIRRGLTSRRIRVGHVVSLWHM